MPVWPFQKEECLIQTWLQSHPQFLHPGSSCGLCSPSLLSPSLTEGCFTAKKEGKKKIRWMRYRQYKCGTAAQLFICSKKSLILWNYIIRFLKKKTNVITLKTVFFYFIHHFSVLRGSRWRLTFVASLYKDLNWHYNIWKYLLLCKINIKVKSSW